MRIPIEDSYKPTRLRLTEEMPSGKVRSHQVGEEWHGEVIDVRNEHQPIGLWDKYFLGRLDGIIQSRGANNGWDVAFPPKASMLSRTHSNATHWSLKPKFPEIGGSSEAKKPKADSLIHRRMNAFHLCEVMGQYTPIAWIYINFLFLCSRKLCLTAHAMWWPKLEVAVKCIKNGNMVLFIWTNDLTPHGYISWQETPSWQGMMVGPRYLGKAFNPVTSLWYSCKVWELH